MAAAAAEKRNRGTGDKERKKNRTGADMGIESFDPVTHVTKEKADTISMWLVISFAATVSLLMRYVAMPSSEDNADMLWFIPMMSIFLLPSIHRAVLSAELVEHYTKGTWFQTLGNKLQAVSNAIHQKTLRGGANFIVVSPEVATIIESIPGYASDANGDAANGKFAMGVQKVGALTNRYNVYKNPYMTEDEILIGFRGSNFLETGAVYAPYVPLIMTPLVYDPKNFTPRKGVMTRYAKKIVRPEYYGKVIVADSNLV